MATQLVKLKDSDVMRVEQEAKQLIQKVSTTDTMELEGLMDTIGRMGSKTMEQAGQSLAMLERPVNELMSGKRSEVQNNILKLRGEIDSLSKSKQLSLFDRLLRKTTLKNYIYKYQSVKTNVNAIVQSLRDGKETLEENMAYMKTLKKNSLEAVYNLHMRIEMGEKMKQLFEDEIAKTDNESRKSQLERGLRKVVTRIQSFHEMVILYQQAIAGTDIINDNNDKLIDAVSSTIDKTQNLLTVSAMISMAIEDQVQTIEAVNSANATLNKMFEENSRLLKETTQNTNDLLGNPGLQMDSIERGMADLFAALDLFEQSNRTIIQTATEHNKRLSSISQQMTERIGLNSGSNKNAEMKKAEFTGLLE
ncbi:toxic anion resistance protein [Paenibacillus thiaminolyticus]|uniref:toxic anion resistance protein n=1 Tax=Paenibacillus thiaminolyticus TaxID=49283 RepID=UPI00232F2F2D|nr:toxic anion resistance protein [Paenibacillus thiaminolyticus]WCF08361.1 toxic anion resistance protein [Paenibacillus thiaminolyticus]